MSLMVKMCLIFRILHQYIPYGTISRFPIFIQSSLKLKRDKLLLNARLLFPCLSCSRPHFHVPHYRHWWRQFPKSSSMVLSICPRSISYFSILSGSKQVVSSNQRVRVWGLRKMPLAPHSLPGLDLGVLPLDQGYRCSPNHIRVRI